METDLLNVSASAIFARELAVDESAEGLASALERERARRMRAERVASDMARMVAAESRRAEEEREKRAEAEKVATSMASLVAHENARADHAERLLQELLDSRSS